MWLGRENEVARTPPLPRDGFWRFPSEICLKPKSKYLESAILEILFFLVKQASLTGKIYREEGITKYLVPCIKEYHED